MSIATVVPMRSSLPRWRAKPPPLLQSRPRMSALSKNGKSLTRANCRRPDRQTESRGRFMADKVRVWFDAEADFLEVRFSDAAGYDKETKHDAVMERVDAQGHVIGFSIMGVSKFKK